MQGILSSYLLGIFLGVALVCSVYLIFGHGLVIGWILPWVPERFGLWGELVASGAVIGCVVTTLLLAWMRLQAGILSPRRSRIARQRGAKHEPPSFGSSHDR